jgi:L-fuconolactonase
MLTSAQQNDQTDKVELDQLSTLRIDAHHHLWNYRADEFPWLDESMAGLRRDFSVEDLHEAMGTAQIGAAIAIQARQSIEETGWLLDCADRTDKICAVVGWAPLLARELSSILDKFIARSKLVGLREIVQDEPDGYLDQRVFDRGITELTNRGLAYDLLVRERQLEEAIRFVDRHPHQRFVLDHAAKPRIADREIEPWRRYIFALGERGHVFCKLSGLVTEAEWSNWTLETLRPYLDICVEAFGPHRLMAGSDWPVCLVASTYSNWWSILSEYFALFSETERQRIFGGTAIEFYKLTLALLPTGEVSS